MRARARHGVFYNGTYFRPGDELVVAAPDIAELSQHCDLLGEAPEMASEENEFESSAEKRRGPGRPRKNALED